MRAGLGYLAGAGLLALALGVAYSTPDSDWVEGPMASRVQLGETVTVGDLVGTVHDVSLAREVEADFTTLTTAGIWFVTEFTVAGTTDRTGVRVDVFIDGVQYPATDRSDAVIDGSTVDAGLPRTGPSLVELPADVVDLPGASTAVLRISPRFDSRLDGVIEVVVDLTALELADRVEVESARDGIR
jgi:hypothetical protein